MRRLEESKGTFYYSAPKVECPPFLLNAFSKKWESHELMFALFVAWYNFCRPHMTLKTTPAVAAGLTAEAWTMERLLSESAKAAA
jgi:hypothetical protein